jgi:hypothetical protein
MKNLFLALSIIALIACGGGGGSTPTPTPTPTPTKVGVFRLPKGTPSASVQAKENAYVAAASGNTSIQMTYPRKNHKSALLKQGQVLLLGGEFILPPAGYVGAGQYEDKSYGDIFDSKTELFHPSAATFALKYVYDHDTSFAMIPLPDGRVVLAGGSSVQNGAYQKNGSNSIEIYDPSSDTATELTNVLPDTIWSVESGYYLNAHQVLLNGLKKANSDEFLTYSLLFDLDSHNAVTNVTMIDNPYTYADGMSFQDSNGDVYFLGGRKWDASTTYSDIVMISASDVHAGRGAFNRVGNLLTPKYGAGIVVLNNKEVGIYGGYQIQSGTVTRYAEVEVLNTKTMTSTSKSALLSQVGWLTSVLLQGDGYTFHAGGVDATGFTANAEYVHNAEKNISGSTGTMVEPRRFHNVVALNNGQVLITGGETQLNNSNGVVSLKKTAELYDPQSKLYITFPTDQIQQNTTTQFLCDGQLNTNINWSVVREDGVTTGNGTGTIDTNGLYTAPSSVSQDRVIVVTAALKDGSSSASIRIKLLAPVTL